MEINRKIIIIPCLALIFIYMSKDFNLDFEINKYFKAKKLTFPNKTEPSETKRILLWNNSLKKKDFKLDIKYKIQLFKNYNKLVCSRSIKKDDLKIPISFEKLGCPQHRCIITNNRYICRKVSQSVSLIKNNTRISRFFLCCLA